MIKFLILFLIAEPLLFTFTSGLSPIYFHTFIPPAIIIVIGLFYLQKKNKTYIEFRLPSLFFTWAFLLCSYRFVGDVLLRQTLSYWPLLPTLSIAIFLGLYYILCDTDLRLIDNFIPICANLMAIVALIQISGGYHPHKMCGTFGNPTNLGIYIIVCLPYALKKKFLWGIPLLIVVGLSNSASAILGAMTGVIIYLFLKNKRIGIIIFILSLIIGLTFVKYNSTFLNPQGKLAIWIKAIQVWRENPIWMILGRGPGSFEVSRFNDGASWWTRSHNIIIHLLYEFGIIGLILFILFCIKDVLLKKKNTDLKKRAFATICAFVVSSLGFISYHIFPVVVILAFSLACLRR